MGSRVRPRGKEQAEPVSTTPKCRIKDLSRVFSSGWGKAGIPSQEKMLAGPNRVGRSSWEMFGVFSKRSF